MMYFIVLLVAAVMQNLKTFIAVAAFTCGAYGYLLYAEVGPQLWRESAMLVRVPFLFSAALFFGYVASQFRAEREASDHRARGLARVGELGVSRFATGWVLQEIVECVKETLPVDRCSLFLFETGSWHDLATPGDGESSSSVYFLPEEYCADVQSILENRLTEVRGAELGDSWFRLSRFLDGLRFHESALAVPVVLRDSLLGVMLVHVCREDHVFDDAVKTFCRISALMLAAFVHERMLLRELHRHPESGAHDRRSEPVRGAQYRRRTA